MSTTQKLIVDIETIGENFDALDKTTQDHLTRWIRRESDTEEEYKLALEDLKQGLGFSPLTGEIVAIGMLDYHKNEGAVYFQAPGAKLTETKEEGILFKPMTESEMLKKFWEIALKYQVFITFNGRGFDVPFMMIRSAVYGIRPTKDLMRGRYLHQHTPDALHIDLLEQFTFYGAVRRKGSLHLWARIFGIESPKASGVTGDDIGPLFKKKKYLEIARYNAKDIKATKELYEKWEKYLQF